jgi:hypothetical protein
MATSQMPSDEQQRLAADQQATEHNDQMESSGSDCGCKLQLGFHRGFSSNTAAPTEDPLLDTLKVVYVTFL